MGHHLRTITILLIAAAALVLGACSRAESYPVRTYQMGERIELGHIVYTVFERQWLTQIGDGPTARVPQNRFFLLRMSAVNGGGDDIVMPSLVLIDDKGTTYPELNLKSGEGVPQWAGYLRQVAPAQVSQGNIVFDCPPQHYKLRLTDENQDRTAFVDIPLSFDSETPEVAIPGAAKKQ